jgi:hypothetical protein
MSQGYANSERLVAWVANFFMPWRVIFSVCLLQFFPYIQKRVSFHIHRAEVAR